MVSQAGATRAGQRIAFDHQIFGHQRYGGISRYFVRLAEHLLALGEQVRVFAPVHVNALLGRLPRSAVLGRHLTAYPPKTGFLFTSGSGGIARMAIQNWKPTVVHETYFSRQPSAPRGCPTVVTVYDMIHERFPEMYPPQDQTSRLKRIAVERADHVVCISENTRVELIRAFGVSSGKLTVVHLGADAPSPGTASVRGSSDGRPFLLFVGSRVRYKNFIGFLGAFAASPRLRLDFDVVAFGGGEFSAAENEAVASLGLDRSRIRSASGGDDTLGGLYRQARALVYPSLYEGFGLPPLEAMAHGCPVVSSNTSALPEVIGDAAEFFAPSSLEHMRQAIERVAYSDERRVDLIKRGLRRAEAFSWRTCAEQTLAIYESLRA